MTLSDADRTALAGWTDIAPGGTPRFQTSLPDGQSAIVSLVGAEWVWRLLDAGGVPVAVGDAPTAEQAVVAAMRLAASGSVQ